MIDLDDLRKRPGVYMKVAGFFIAAFLIAAFLSTFFLRTSRDMSAEITTQSADMHEWRIRPVPSADGATRLQRVMETEGASSDSRSFEPGTVLVKMKEKAPIAAPRLNDVDGAALAPQPLQNILEQFGAGPGLQPLLPPMARMKDIGRIPTAFPAPEFVEREEFPDTLFVASFPLTGTPEDYVRTEQLAALLAQQPEVEYAELNHTIKALWEPNDPYFHSSGSWGQPFADLWGLHKMSVGDAWDVSRGQGVVVAVTDTGVDGGHPDIAANMWRNTGEANCGNGIDDDGNGYVDDCAGWDFINGDKDPMDDNGHGTHVAGTIAASANNAIGIAGVAPEARIMSLKVLGANGGGLLSYGVQAIVYAAQNGAKVINASWGANGTSQILQDAIRYAHDEKDVVVVAAAGNRNADVEQSEAIPAMYEEVITVAASTALDQKAPFSNHGAKIDVAAPGGGDSGNFSAPERSILSLKASQASPDMIGNGALIVGGIYLRQAGTSMAAPHAAGVAAIVRSLHPEFTAEQVRLVIRAGADDIGPPGFDPQFGYGRVNAARTVLSPSPPLLHFRFTPPAVGQESLAVFGTVQHSSLARWTLEYGAGRLPSQWTLIADGTQPVVDGLLAQWDISMLLEDVYVLRLTAEFQGNDRLTITRTLQLSNIQLIFPPIADFRNARGLMNLVSGQAPIAIRGTVAPPRLRQYTLSLRRQNGSVVPDLPVSYPGDGTSPAQGVIGIIDPSNLPADFYTLVLSVENDAGMVATREAFLTIDPTLHSNWPQKLTMASSGYFFDPLSNTLTAVDLQGSGRAAIIVGYLDAIRAYDGNGSQLPGWPVVIPNENVQSIAAADFGEGMRLLALTTTGQNINIPCMLRMFRPDGTQEFARQITPCPNYDHQKLFIEDLQGDGTSEIILGSMIGIFVFDRWGNVAEGWPQRPEWSFFPRIALGDVNGDGQTEIVALNDDPGATDRSLYVYRADGAPLPGWPKIVSSSTVYRLIPPPVLADLNGDGAKEIIVGGNDERVYVFRSDSSLLPGWPQESPGSGISGLVVGDIDGDGPPEVVIGTEGRESGIIDYLMAWKTDGTPLSGWPVIRRQTPIRASAGFFGFGTPAIADIDGDGEQEVLASSDITWPFRSFAAYKRDGSEVPGFPKYTDFLGMSHINTATVADIDGDGELEIAHMGMATGSFGVYIYLWDVDSPAENTREWPMVHNNPGMTSCWRCLSRPLPPSSSSSPFSSSNPPSSSFSSSPFSFSSSPSSSLSSSNPPSSSSFPSSPSMGELKITKNTPDNTDGATFIYTISPLSLEMPDRTLDVIKASGQDTASRTIDVPVDPEGYKITESIPINWLASAEPSCVLQDDTSTGNPLANDSITNVEIITDQTTTCGFENEKELPIVISDDADGPQRFAFSAINRVEQQEGFRSRQLHGGYWRVRPGGVRECANHLQAAFSFSNVPPGEWEFFATWAPHDASLPPEAESRALYIIRDINGGVIHPSVQMVDQRQEPEGIVAEGRTWQSIGKIQTDGGGPVLVVLAPLPPVDANKVRGQILADAVMMLPVEPSTSPPPPPTTSPPPPPFAISDDADVPLGPAFSAPHKVVDQKGFRSRQLHGGYWRVRPDGVRECANHLQAAFPFLNVPAGEWEFFATWAPHDASLPPEAESRALYIIRDINGGVIHPSVQMVDQRQEPEGIVAEGRTWQSIGKIQTDGGGPVLVVLAPLPPADESKVRGQILADAIMMLPAWR